LAFHACEKLRQVPDLLIGTDDATGKIYSAVLQFHRTYRALRRARIAAWHLQDPSVRDHEKWRERARCYVELARPVAT